MQANTRWVADASELSNALDRASAGDTVILMPGTYRLGRFESRRGGTEKAPITVKAIAPGRAIIETDRVETFSIYHPYWIFEKLVIKGTDSTHHAFHLSDDADHVIIRNNKLVNFHSHIKSNGRNGHFPDRVLIEGNQISNDGVRETSEPTSPIDVVGGSDWVVRNNFVADFSRTAAGAVSYGIFLKGNSRKGLIEQNLVICSWQHQGGYRIGLSLGGGGTGLTACEKQDCRYEHRFGTIQNNIVLNCSDAGIFLKKAANSHIYHNTLINTLGIDAQLPSTSAVIENNYVGGVIQARKDASIEKLGNLTTSWGWIPYSETIARYFSHRVSDYHMKYPSFFDKEDIETIQQWVNNFGSWVADTPMGLGRNKAFEDFNNFPYGDLTPEDDELLDTAHKVSSVTKDFWGNPRNPNRIFIGALDLLVSSCDIKKKITTGSVRPAGSCLMDY